MPSCTLAETDECSSFQEIIKERRYEREDVQEKTFTKWINSQLIKHEIEPVNNLFNDLRDGLVLIRLMEVLTDKSIRPEIGRLRVHHIGNVNMTINLLRDYGIRLVNVNSGDIVDGNKKLTLALIWALILAWQVNGLLRKVVDVDCDYSCVEKTLLKWCRQQTAGYRNVNIEDFGASWENGLAFNALLHKKNPQLFNYDLLLKNDASENLGHAFRTAKDIYGVDEFLEVEDIVNGESDKKSIMVYVMALMDINARLSEQTQQLSQSYSRDVLCRDYHTFAQTANDLMCRMEDFLGAALTKMIVPIDDIKELVNELNDFEHQTSSIAYAGSELLRSSTISEQDRSDVSLFLEIIQTLWENVKRKVKHQRVEDGNAYDISCSLDAIERWVRTTEEKVAQLSNSSSSVQDLQDKLSKLKQIKNKTDEMESKLLQIKQTSVTINANDLCNIDDLPSLSGDPH